MGQGENRTLIKKTPRCFEVSFFEIGFTDNYFDAFRECSIFLLYFIDNCKKLLGEIRIYFICFIDKYVYS